jgi:energy-converting hydrogenase Eha subunit E
MLAIQKHQCVITNIGNLHWPNYGYELVKIKSEFAKVGIEMYSFDYITGVMVFNATFNNISVILWRSALLVEETGENYRPAASH